MYLNEAFITRISNLLLKSIEKVAKHSIVISYYFKCGANIFMFCMFAMLVYALLMSKIGTICVVAIATILMALLVREMYKLSDDFVKACETLNDSFKNSDTPVSKKKE